MPIGARVPGVATGPAVGPRLSDPGPIPGVGSGWRPSGVEAVVLGWRDELRTGVESGGTGIILATLDAVGAGLVVLIDRLFVSTTSASPTTAKFYAGVVDDANLREFTPAGNLDVADESSPIMFSGAAPFVCRWTGASALAVGYCRFQFRVVQLTGGGQ